MQLNTCTYVYINFPHINEAIETPPEWGPCGILQMIITNIECVYAHACDYHLMRVYLCVRHAQRYRSIYYIHILNCDYVFRRRRSRTKNWNGEKEKSTHQRSRWANAIYNLHTKQTDSLSHIENVYLFDRIASYGACINTFVVLEARNSVGIIHCMIHALAVLTSDRYER